MLAIFVQVETNCCNHLSFMIDTFAVHVFLMRNIDRHGSRTAHLCGTCSGSPQLYILNIYSSHSAGVTATTTKENWNKKLLRL